MTNQDILEKLAELECTLFYRADGSDNTEGVDPEKIWVIHQKVKEALEGWHKLTGLTIL